MNITVAKSGLYGGLIAKRVSVTCDDCLTLGKWCKNSGQNTALTHNVTFIKFLYMCPIQLSTKIISDFLYLENHTVL